MFDWLRKKRRGGENEGKHDARRGDAATAQSGPSGGTESTARGAPQGRLPFGHWVWMDMRTLRPESKERFVGYVYVDPGAGPSVKGGPESANFVELPMTTVRLPMPLMPMQVLAPDEISARGLPAAPAWLAHFGPQPDLDAPWHRDPDLRGRFHASWPDDLQVLVHDGEPRRTERKPELCWVRVVAAEPGPPRWITFVPDVHELSERELAQKYRRSQTVYVATLLNAPEALVSIRQGDAIRFLAGGGLEHPLLVTPQYLAERAGWKITLCSECGMSECLDPPSVMARLRFPDNPPGATVQNFTSFCALCGGMQMLSRADGTATG